MSQDDIWSELQVVISEELLGLIDSKDKQAPNVIIGLNIHNNKKKVKNS